MKDQETQQQFIGLRVKGWSFDRIAREINTSKRTLRRQIQSETGSVKFTSPISEIPNDEYHEQVQDWKV